MMRRYSEGKGLPSGIRRAFRLGVGRRIEHDVDDEIAFHVEMRVAELVARGMSHDAARTEALRRFGNTQRWSTAMRAVDRERVGHERRAEWLDDLRQDLRFGVRALVRAPLFSLVAVLTLAVGIGANAVVFGVLKSVLLDALPYADAGRLASIHTRTGGSSLLGILSAGSVADIAARQRSFESLAAHDLSAADGVFGGADGAHVIRTTWVEEGFFRTLGVRAALGRTFRDDDASPDTAWVVVVAHGAWQRLFGGDSAVLGQRVQINGIPRTVIGILPRDFAGPIGTVDFYYCFDLAPLLSDPVRVRRRHWLGLVGRLNPGVSHDAASREMAAIGEQLVQEHPVDNAGLRFASIPLRDAMVGDTRTPLLVLAASALLVLVIACANLAGALLSRTLTRRREFAVRVALGAGRGRLVRQLLTESLLLAAAGGAAGLLLANLGLGLARGMAGRALPAHVDVGLDGGAILVMVAITLATGLAFGLAPALSVGRGIPQGALRGESRGTSESRRSRQLRGVLVAGQIALCMSLLAGAGLLARSLRAMSAEPIGFDPEHLLVVSTQLPGGAYRANEARTRFFEQFEDGLRGIPGVAGVASGSALPTTMGERNGFTIVGSPWRDGAEPFVLYASVSDDYFRTMGIPVLQGRTFGSEDQFDSQPVVILSESMARRWWPGGNALGARIRIGPDVNATPLQVVGIVGDVRNDRAATRGEPITYLPRRQNPWDTQRFVLRTHGDPLALVRPVESALRELDPRIPLHPVRTMREILGESLAGRKLPVVLMTAFGSLALLLASLGVYAMFSSMAAAREREFGLRMALGSSRRAIATLVLRQGGAWMAAGLVAGAAGVALVSRMVRGLLYGVAPLDAVALGVALVLLVACATLALLVPVRRATRVDPITILR